METSTSSVSNLSKCVRMFSRASIRLDLCSCAQCSSLILFSSPYWLSLVINRFQLSPCFRDCNVSSVPRPPQRLFDKDSAVSETKGGKTNGCQRSQFMLRSCQGKSSTPMIIASASLQQFTIGVVLIKAGLKASRDD